MARLAELAQQSEDPRESLGAEVALDHRGVGPELGQIAAAGEDRRVRRGEDDDADSRVVASGEERRFELCQQLL